MPSVCADWYAEAGYDVVRTESAAWFSASRQVYQSLPLGRPVAPDAAETEQLVRARRLVGVQYASTETSGMQCAIYTMRDPDYGEHSLHRTFRQHLGRARIRCSVRELGFDELERLALPVNAEVMARHSYDDPRYTDATGWRRFCAAGARHAGAGAIGVFVGSGLEGYLLYVLEDGVSYGLHMMTRLDLRELGGNHLLYYEFTRRMIERADVAAVNTGAGLLRRHRGLDRFKRHAGYTAEAATMRVVLHPLVRPVLASRPCAALLARGARRRRDTRLARLHDVVDMARAADRTSVP